MQGLSLRILTSRLHHGQRCSVHAELQSQNHLADLAPGGSNYHFDNAFFAVLAASKGNEVMTNDFPADSELGDEIKHIDPE